MLFEQIEKEKTDYTDKYVVVDGTRPELARFKDVVGQVKTVNMSGRALVEFLDYHLNIGWYDIDPHFLKVVDKPPPKVEKPAEKKPAAKAEAKPAAAAKTPAKPAAAPQAGKPSVADILAAARAGKGGSPAAGAATSVAAKETPPAPAPAKPAAKTDRSKMSVADMLAAARAGGAAGPAKTPANVEPPAETPTDGAATSVAVEAAPQPPATESTEKIDKSKMSIDDMLAWCRKHDSK